MFSYPELFIKEHFSHFVFSPEVESRGHIIDRIFVVQPAEAVLGVTLPGPPVQVTAPVYNNTEDSTLYKHIVNHLSFMICADKYDTLKG